MADYQMSVRIPQETADKMIEIIKQFKQNNEGAELTMAIITRAALDQYISVALMDAIHVSIEGLSKSELGKIFNEIQDLSVKHENPEKITAIEMFYNKVASKLYYILGFKFIKKG